MSLLWTRAAAFNPRKGMAWRVEPGQEHHAEHAKSVRDAGFGGYVDHSEDMRHEYDDNEDEDDHDSGFDEELHDRTTPEPTAHERRHYDRTGDWPESFHDRHGEAYDHAVQEKQQREHRENTPDVEDDELMDFVGNHGTNKKFWNKHAKFEPVDIKSQPVYATQSHVSQSHIDKYLRNPHATTHEDRGDGRYLGDEAPLMVTHQGALHTIEGHHRVAAALQRGDHQIHAWHFNADEHGGLPDAEGNMPDHEDYEEHWSR